ncbi:MAG: uroporphyrinogen-III synthase [Bacteroidales bacterium]|nr:uroporphyrinogen-III synthase [Bacteroidales bacterium]
MSKRVKSILVSQPKPQSDKSPYFDLAEKYNLTIDFRSFIHVEPISASEFRQSKINILDFSAVFFTSRTAIDHYFRLAEELRITIPDEMKYFCISEATAFYLQKYIVYRKRKIFYGNGKFDDLLTVAQKHKDEKFLIPLSDIHKQSIPASLDSAGFKYIKAIMYRTVLSDLSDLADIKYDVLVFFSPSGIKSLFQNFPDFEQGETRIAAFGPTTAKAVEEAGLRLDINAPHPKAPSMTMALEQYVKEANKKK